MEIFFRLHSTDSLISNMMTRQGVNIPCLKNVIYQEYAFPMEKKEVYICPSIFITIRVGKSTAGMVIVSIAIFLLNPGEVRS